MIRRLIAATLAAIALAGCTSGGVATTTSVLPADAIPATTFAGTELDDLRVEAAEVADDVEGREGLLVATGLWRVLEAGEVVATVQVGDVVEGVDDLEARLLGQFGAVRPRAVRVGDHVVHVSSGNGRTDTLALVDRRMVVVRVDDAFTRRRALVRHLLDVVHEVAS